MYLQCVLLRHRIDDDDARGRGLAGAFARPVRVHGEQRLQGSALGTKTAQILPNSALFSALFSEGWRFAVLKMTKRGDGQGAPASLAYRAGFGLGVTCFVSCAVSAGVLRVPVLANAELIL